MGEEGGKGGMGNSEHTGHLWALFYLAKSLQAMNM